MAINSNAIIDDLASLCETLAYFDRVNRHEPKDAPGRGLTAAIWVDSIEPARGRSGLASTTARVTFNIRIYTSMLQEPQDMIDPSMMEACDKLMEALAGDFELGGDVAFIDLLGATQGHPLQAESGYININNKVYRVLTMTVPVIVNDAWTQAS